MDEGRPAGQVRPVTKADADLPHGQTRGLVAGTGGTANLMDVTGEILVNYPLAAGYHPLKVRQVRTGGTATDIWALY